MMVPAQGSSQESGGTGTGNGWFKGKADEEEFQFDLFVGFTGILQVDRLLPLLLSSSDSLSLLLSYSLLNYYDYMTRLPSCSIALLHSHPLTIPPHCRITLLTLLLSYSVTMSVYHSLTLLLYCSITRKVSP